MDSTINLLRHDAFLGVYEPEELPGSEKLPVPAEVPKPPGLYTGLNGWAGRLRLDESTLDTFDIPENSYYLDAAFDLFPELDYDTTLFKRLPDGSIIRLPTDEELLRLKQNIIEEHAYGLIIKPDATNISRSYGLETPSDTEGSDVDVEAEVDTMQLVGQLKCTMEVEAEEVERSPVEAPNTPPLDEEMETADIPNAILDVPSTSAAASNRSSPGPSNTILDEPSTSAAASNPSSPGPSGSTRGRPTRGRGRGRGRPSRNATVFGSRRDQHNESEKRRRQTQAQLINELGNLMPDELEGLKRSKLNILLQTAILSRRLTAEAQELREQEDEVKATREALDARLEELREAKE